MAVLSWGKPTVEIGVSTGAAATTFTSLPDIKEGTAKLTTTPGNTLKATAEGGALIDVRKNVNSSVFECEIFVKKGATKPIADADGVILTNHTLRLTPEDVTLEGFIMDYTSVSVVETWSSQDGKIWKYTFEGLKPTTGNILKPYTKP